MPNYPAMEEQDLTQPLDLSNLKFSLSEHFGAQFSSTYGHYQENEIINNLSKVKPNPAIPSSYPLTKKEVEDIEVERPGLKIPVGLPKFVGGVMSSVYDDDKRNGLISQASPGIIGNVAAMGGAIAGATLNIRSLIAGSATASAARMAGATIAQKAMSAMGASEIFGSQAARIGTLIIEKGIEAGGFMFGSSATEEIATQQRHSIMDEPHNYLASLQNVGKSTLYGIPFGMTLGLIGFGLMGRRVVRLPDGSFIDREPLAGETSGREGGLLNRPEFKNLHQTAKDYIAKVYKPWSKDADITMREEATGQMMNGQTVDIEPVLKQGMADEGQNFRQAIAEYNKSATESTERLPVIDPEELDRQLAEAQENITSEMFTKHFDDDFVEPIKRISIIDQLNAARNESKPKVISNSEKFERLFEDTDTPNEFININEIPDNGERISVGGMFKNKLPTRKIATNINNLISDIAKSYPPKEIVEAIDKGIYKDDGLKNSIEEIKNLENKLNELIEKSAPDIRNKQRLDGLNNQHMLAQSLRDHLNDTHEPVTQADLQAYGERLQSPGMPDNGFTTETEKGLTIDDHLNEFSEEQIRSLAELFKGDKETIEELESTRNRISKQKVFEDMTKNLTDCILKGGL